MLGMFKRNVALPKTWNELSSLGQLEEINVQSQTKPCIIFKHSTRCSISSNAYARLERGSEKLGSKADFYYLDLLAHRDISNAIATNYRVVHESPQILIIHYGKCVGHTSHNGVSVDNILNLI